MRGFVLFGFLWALPALAADEKRPAAAVLKTESATVLAREADDKPWKPVEQKQEIAVGDLLIGLNDAVVTSTSKAVDLRFHTDLNNRSPFPIIEAAVRLNVPKDADLDLWLDRGRVDFVNVREKGPATVVVRFRTRVWTMVLEKPGTRVTMEIYGRFPEGHAFREKPKADEGPLAGVLLLVLKGSVQRSCSLCSTAMTEPPGPSQFGWDSIHGDDTGPKKLEAVPSWAKDEAKDTPEMKKRLAAREKFRKTILDHGLEKALAGLLKAEDAEIRRVGVYALGAFDQIEMLGELLTQAKEYETWNHVVVAMRHWLGRAPGQEQMLFKALVVKRKYTPAHARIVMQLLLGFTEEQRERPEVYSLLIDLLRHDKLAIRGLAFWHLKRLAPKVEVAYDPTADKEAWDKAHAAYKDKIPDGKLPPTN